MSQTVTITGCDRPGATAEVLTALAHTAATVVEIEQLVVADHLVLTIEVDDIGAEDLSASLSQVAETHNLALALSASRPQPGDRKLRHLVTILGAEVGAESMAGMLSSISEAGGQATRVQQLGRYPVVSYEIEVLGGHIGTLKKAAAAAAARHGLDVAVQGSGLRHRSQRLIVLDVDSTLVQGEVVDLLAAMAGCEEEVAAITASAMAGELDFADALRRRVALLEGLSIEALDEVRRSLKLTPGARTLVRTLRSLGHQVGIVSGGFTEVINPLAGELGIDLVAANVLEVESGRLTGKLLGPIIDRAGKAAALVSFAEKSGIPLPCTVAVGDGANDLDMLAIAGLGVAFNAKPVVRDAADTSVNVPFLDTVLYLLGLRQEDVEAAKQSS